MGFLSDRLESFAKLYPDSPSKEKVCYRDILTKSLQDKRDAHNAKQPSKKAIEGEFIAAGEPDPVHWREGERQEEFNARLRAQGVGAALQGQGGIGMQGQNPYGGLSGGLGGGPFGNIFGR